MGQDGAGTYPPCQRRCRSAASISATTLSRLFFSVLTTTLPRLPVVQSERAASAAALEPCCKEVPGARALRHDARSRAPAIPLPAPVPTCGYFVPNNWCNSRDYSFVNNRRRKTIMTDAPWYKTLFGEDYLRMYEPVLTPERTQREVDGIVNLLALPQGSCILDLCCGHGRHSIALAQHGYQVTGQDLSEVFLHEAEKEA